MGSQPSDNKMRGVTLLLLLPFYSTQSKTKSLTETDDAYILDVDLDDKKAAANTQTRVLGTGNPLVDGAVVGIGVGVIGSLLVGSFLDHQKKQKCVYRYKRDPANPASTRFLPGKCPPYHNGYQPSNNGYQPPQVNGYQPPQSNGYRPPQTNGYQSPQNNGYRPPQNNGYRPPQTSGYRPPQNNGYQPAQINGYQPIGYTNGRQNVQGGVSFGQTTADKATPAPFNFGVGK